MRNHQQPTDIAGNRCQSFRRVHPVSMTSIPLTLTTTAAATTSSSAAGSGTLAIAVPMSTTTATLKSTIMLDDDLAQQQQQQQQASHAKHQKQHQQHPNKLSTVAGNNEKVKISNSVNKYTTVTLPSLLAKENSNSLLHVNRKQFTPTSDGSNASFSSASVAGSIQDDMSDQCSLTQAGLEEYNIRASSYYDQPVLFHHQKQSSYAQSEGYHSYVSSSDSSSATPFLDRLRQESDLLSRQSSHNWSQNDLSSLSCNSIAPSPIPLGSLCPGLNGQDLMADGVNNNSIKNNESCMSGSNSSGNNNNNNIHNNNNNHNSSESTSSTETLKWLGSTSDISEASHATGYSAISESVSSSQLIVHSSRVLSPKRHHSESVLYLNDERPPSPPPIANTTPHNAHSQLPTQHAQETSPPSSLSSSSSRPSPNHRYSPSYPPVHTMTPLSLHNSYHQHFAASKNTEASSSLTCLPQVPMELGTPPGVSDDESSPILVNHKSSLSVTLSNSEAIATPSPRNGGKANTELNDAGEELCQDLPSSDISALGASISNATSATLPLTVTTNSVGCVTINTITPPSLSPASSTTSSDTSPGGGLVKNSSSYRSNHRLFPVSTYTEPVHSNTSHYVHHPKPQYSTGLQKPVTTTATTLATATGTSPTTTSLTTTTTTVKQSGVPQTPPQSSWQSVAALINDFERTTVTDTQQQTHVQQQQQLQQQQQQLQQQQQQQQIQKYGYIEPSKTHRVSNPALKAFQKNAVQSYFERQQAQQQQQQQHQHQQQQHSKDSNHQQLQQKIYQQPQPQLVRPHSYQPTASAREVVAQQMLRNSLPATSGSSKNAHLTSPLTHTKPEPPLDELTTAYVLGSAKPPSPAPPPPPPRSRSLMPAVSLLRRSSSASDYAEYRDQYTRATQEKLQAQSVKNISSAEKMSFNDCGMPPPPPPPRGRPSLSTRRTSSASEYAAMRDKAMLQQAAALAHQQHHPHQHHATTHNAAMRTPHHPQQQQQHYYYSAPPPPLPPPTQQQANVNDGWVPERPPKNPNMRIPSPEPPPPPPAEYDASLSDEPLPPPPPEILNRPPQVPAGYNEPAVAGDLLPNRRNSFAGSSTRKALFMRTTSVANDMTAKPPPPVIPKKPTSIELLQLARPSSSLAQQQANKAHKVLLNGPSVGGGSSGSSRKRPHNPALMSMPPPIQEHSTTPTTTAATGKASIATSSKQSPPPLMPRMTAVSTHLQGPPSAVVSLHSSKQRCNSKASYLPRQSLEKLNNSDPDHGSYKLTLTSNEDFVSANPKASYESTTATILSQTGNKLPHNLPDVLPLGAKLQPSSPTATTTNGPNGGLRYGSNNNLSTSGNSPTQQHGYPMYPAPPPAAHRYSTPTMTAYHNISSSGSVTSLASSNSNGSGQYPHYNRSQSYDVNRNTTNTSPNANHNPNVMHSPTKAMSQSTMDLKRTHSQLETTLEEAVSPGDSSKVLSPAQSENNLSVNGSNTSSSSSSTAPKHFNSEDRISEKPAEGRIFRAECVNTTLVSAVHKAITRKESLRENIEKITQLQSKLMSAHVSPDTGHLIGNYSPVKAVSTSTTTATTTRPMSGDDFERKSLVTQQSIVEVQEDLSVEQSNAHVEHDKQLDDVPDTPPPPPPQTPPPSLDDEDEEQESPKENPAAATHETVAVPTQISQMDSNMDGLKLMQRSEIVLRVNPTTTEASCQTDDLGDCDYNGLAMPTHKDEAQTRTTLQPRRRHPIEIDCDNMSKELVSLLGGNDKLIDVLAPQTVKTPTDYISNLYNPNVPLRPGKRDVGTSTLMRMKSSASKAETTAIYQFADIEVTLCNGSDDDGHESDGLKRKVDDLMRNINRKIRILNNEQTSIGEEAAANDELGTSLVSKLADKVRPIEASKCRTYIDDVGYITSLLLSLSERLARTENSLATNSGEKKILESKRDRLLEQLEEAKHLKEDIDRRGTIVTGVLEKNLSSDDYADFDYFINMKAKLIADSRDIADKIKCGEEQLSALSEALIQSDC